MRTCILHLVITEYFKSEASQAHDILRVALHEFFPRRKEVWEFLCQYYSKLPQSLCYISSSNKLCATFTCTGCPLFPLHELAELPEIFKICRKAILRFDPSIACKRIQRSK